METTAGMLAQAASAGSARFALIKALIIDDFTPMRRLLHETLEQVGIKDIDETGESAAALAKLREQAYGLVLLDWEMPLISGRELLKAIRHDERLKGLTVIVMTTEAEAGQVIAAARDGADDCIVKPFSPHVLAKKLGRALALAAGAPWPDNEMI